MSGHGRNRRPGRRVGGGSGESGRRDTGRSSGRPRPVRPTAGARPVDRARQAAFDVLRQVDEKSAYANLALPALLTERALTGRDAAFATELCYGALRTAGTLDAILAECSHRPVDRIDGRVRDALRLGAYQLLHTRVPAHAAVSTTVALIRAVSGVGSARFGNAVLRRVATRDLPGWLDTVAPDSDPDPDHRLAIRHAHPVWVVRALRAALAEAPDELPTALAADNERPAVDLAARPGRISRDELAARTGGTPGRWSPYAVRLPGGAPGELPEVTSGAAGVQDEGSQLVALALAAAPLAAGPDRHWLDLCAGPGGKSALLGSLAAAREADLLAVEIAEHRAGLVEKATAGLPVRVLCADGRQVGGRPDLPAGHFDRVLVDAPCTGLGALRRRPEARWRRQPSDVDDLVALQRALLSAALRAARPGGVVGYVTCSPHPAETREVLAWITDAPPVPVELLDARPLLPGSMPALGPGPTVQLWPHRHGTDAMFLALLRRLP